MLLFCCKKKYGRREGIAPPFLRLQKLLKGLRLREATIFPPRFENYFFATKMFHCANNINRIHKCGVQITIYLNFHGMQWDSDPSPTKKYAPISPPPKKKEALEPLRPENF